MAFIEGSAFRTFRVDAPPTNGTNGTFVGRAPKGILLMDTSTGTLYVNRGDIYDVDWHPVSQPV